VSEPSLALPSRTLHRFDAVALGLWLGLVALQLGWIGFARYGWAFNLWNYLPLPAGIVFGGVSLAVCSAPVRTWLLARAARLLERFDALASGRRRALAIAGSLAFALAMWGLRERYATGDSNLLLFAARGGWTFVFPEPGASFLIHWTTDLFEALGWESMDGLRALSCVCVIPMLWFLSGAARHLAPVGLRSGFVLLVLSGGLLRVFAGHAEVYAPLLVCVSAYLWAALAYLDRRCSGWLPALALGIAIWMHMAAMALGPSLLALPWLVAQRDGDAPRILRALAAGLLSTLPLLAFIGSVMLFGHELDVRRALRTLIEIAGQSNAEKAVRWWVRGWGSYPSIGTDVIFLSWPHLKYLINASSLLAPSALPIVVGWLVVGRGTARSSPAALLLFVAAAPLVVYACLLRPFWGPYDWDLFSATALLLAILAAHVVTSGFAPALRAHVALLIVVLQLAFFGLPFIGTALGGWRDAGPFQPYRWHRDLRAPRTPPPDELAPWL
jgi:hypothetical protein